MEVEQSLSARDAIMRTVRSMIADDPHAARAFWAMSDQGFAKVAIEVEIALAFVCCLWETSRGMTDRFAQVCEGLANGLTAEQLFPDSLRDGRRTQRSYEPPGMKPS